MSTPLSVGVIGAGPVTQAIHLPTLATLTDRFRVVHVMDVDANVAAAVAGVWYPIARQVLETRAR